MHASPPTLLLAAPPRPARTSAPHAVQFYEDEEYLHDCIADHAADALRADEPLLLLATRERWRAVGDRLLALDVDVNAAARRGRLHWVDARELLARTMANEGLDPVRFRARLSGLLERAAALGGGQPVHVYCELSDVLWRDGSVQAALDLEECWNELAQTHAFALLCTYAIGSFYRTPHVQALEELCAQHTHLAAPELPDGGGDPELRLRGLTRLQDRALRLELEVHRREQLESALRQALREASDARDAAQVANSAKSDFLAVVSHELRTPLTAILGYNELLSAEVSGPLNTPQRQYLEGIRLGAEQLLRLIEQILSLSRIEAGREEVDIEDADVLRVVHEVAAMVEPLARQKQLAFELALPGAPLHFPTDADKLRQILLNLLANAVKFTSDGRVRLVVRQAENELVCEVSDTGIGIRAEDLERIFDPFVQADSGTTRGHNGTGLGLSVSRRLARLLGGSLTVFSAPGQGSSFVVRLPSS